MDTKTKQNFTLILRIFDTRMLKKEKFFEVMEYILHI